jgi:hypothetical protein
MRRCSVCNQEKSNEDYYKRQSACKACVIKRSKQNKENNRERYKAIEAARYQKHRDEILKQAKVYRETHKREIAEKDRRYREKNKEVIAQAQRDYRKTNKDRLRKNKREYMRFRLKRDIGFKLQQRLRCRIHHAVSGYTKKSRKTVELLGCSFEALKQWLSYQFEPGMTWDNYGEWHIDHVRPCASFDLTDPEQQKQCFHWTNLQPLWAKDNLKKSDKWRME